MKRLRKVNIMLTVNDLLKEKDVKISLVTEDNKIRIEVKPPIGFTKKHIEVQSDKFGKIEIIGKRTSTGKTSGLKKIRQFSYITRQPSIKEKSIKFTEKDGVFIVTADLYTQKELVKTHPIV